MALLVGMWPLWYVTLYGGHLARPDHCVAKLFSPLFPSGARGLQFSWLVAPQMCNPAALHRTRPCSHTLCSHAPILPLPKMWAARVSSLFTVALGHVLAGGFSRGGASGRASWSASGRVDALLSGAHGMLWRLYRIRTSIVYAPWIEYTKIAFELYGIGSGQVPKRLCAGHTQDPK